MPDRVYPWIRAQSYRVFGLVAILSVWLLAAAFDGAWANTPFGSASLQPLADAFIASGRPDQSWPRFQGLWVGYDAAGGYQEERVLLKFDASLVPVGSKVKSASLALYMAESTLPDADMTVSAFRISSDWDENVTWNSQPSVVDGLAAASTTISTQPRWYQWDLATALQAWVNGSREIPFSLMLRGDKTGGQHERAFWSKDCSDAQCGGKRPRLEVQWDSATPTPTATATATATPTIAPGVQIQLRSIPSGSVDAGGEITYLIDYWPVGNSILENVVITNAVPSGVAFVEDSIVPSSGQFDGRIVRWELRYLPPGVRDTVSYKVQVFTPTPTHTFTPGPTATATPTRTPTPTDTLTPSRTPTSSVTPTGPRPTDTMTPTPSVTPTSSPSPTASRTPTASPSPSSTPTPSPTATGGTPCSSGKVVGYVFADTNGNGIRNPGESGHAGAKVRLIKDGSEQATDTSRTSGYYEFTNLAFDNYEVELDLASLGPGWANTTLLKQPVTLAGCESSASFGVWACPALTTAVLPTSSGVVQRDPLPNCPSGTGSQPLYNPGTVVTLTANPNPDYTFLNWTGDAPNPPNTANPVQVTMNAAKSVTANFTSCVTVQVAANPAAGGIPSIVTAANCTGGTKYVPGSQISINTTRTTHYACADWTVSGAGTSAAPADTQAAMLTVGTTDTTATANFSQCKTLTKTGAPAAGGTITADPDYNCDGDQYSLDTVVSLTASANLGYAWLNWTGNVPDPPNTANPVQVTMDTNKTVTANFETAMPPLPLSLARAASASAAPWDLSSPKVVIRNEGAYVSWTYNNQRYEYHTPPLINGERIFLPLIIR